MGEKRGRRGWSDNIVHRINSLLLRYNETKPKEIHRKIRTLHYVHYWKGTEFRTLLLYIGLVLFKDFLSLDEFNNYLKLFCAVTICSSEKYKPFLELARQLFSEYIEEYILLYGTHSITSNIHNLCHVVDDVIHFGSLDSMSSYQFENKLHHIKLMVKQCNKPLEQVARRLSEVTACEHASFSIEPELKGPLSEFVFKEIKLKSFVLSSKHAGNRFFLTNENEIVEFECAFYHNGKYFVKGCSLKTKDNFFSNPFQSRFLNIYISDCDKNVTQNYEISCIQAKLFCLPYENRFVFLPILHTFQ